MAGPMGSFAYDSDDGTTYKVRIDTSNASVGGFSAAAGTEPTIPKGTVMRHVWVESAGGLRRKLWWQNTSSANWTGSGGTVALPVEGSAGTVNFTVRGHVGEKRRDI